MTKNDIINLITKYDLLLCIFNFTVYLASIALGITVIKHSDLLEIVFIFAGIGIILNNSYIYTCIKYLNNYENNNAEKLNFFCELLLAAVQIWTAFGFIVGLILLGVDYGS